MAVNDAAITNAPRTTHDDHSTVRGNVPVFINLAFLVLAVCVGSLRVYTRLFIKKWFGSDDVLIIFAIVFTVAQGVEVYIASTKFNLNKHVWDLSKERVAETGKMTYLHNIFFILAANNTHLSWLFFYYRLTVDSDIRWFRNTLHASVGGIVSLFAVFLALAVRMCLPIKAMWAWPPIENASCLRRGEIALAGGIVKTLIDVLLIAIPYPLIAHLNIQISKRVTVLCFFALGSLVVGAGCVRAYYTWRMYFGTDDRTWVAYWAYFWSALEHELGIICACIPPLRPLFGPTIARIVDGVAGNASSLFHKSESEQSADQSTEMTTLQQQPEMTSNYSTRPTVAFEEDSIEQIIWELERR